MECCNRFLDESPVYFDIIPIAISLLFSSDWKNLSTIGFKVNEIIIYEFIFLGAGTWFRGFNVLNLNPISQKFFKFNRNVINSNG